MSKKQKHSLKIHMIIYKIMNKRINLNIKDRKILYVILAIVLVSVFSLTIAYDTIIEGHAYINDASSEPA